MFRGTTFLFPEFSLNVRAISFDKQADCMAWYRALMTRSYANLLNFGDGLELWPQGGPILYDFSTPS